MLIGPKLLTIISAAKNYVFLCITSHGLMENQSINMEAAKPVKHGGKYCVAGAGNKKSCKNTSYTPGISMHVFPSDPRIRAKWISLAASG